ncbi:MAG: hypothetical protein QM699_07580 [Amaricoccus sp.]|uniref:hypothetical protein n=1 Tax=Amaricoccus sp. TaxID=1872485 RepID=UPI0039E38DD2
MHQPTPYPAGAPRISIEALPAGGGYTASVAGEGADPIDDPVVTGPTRVEAALRLARAMFGWEHHPYLCLALGAALREAGHDAAAALIEGIE